MKKIVNYHEIVNLRSSREMGYPMSMIFCGYPFDRSTYVLAKELMLKSKAFIIDLTGTLLDFLPVGTFIPIETGVNTLSRLALLHGDTVHSDKESGRIIITGAHVANNMKTYLAAAASIDDNQPIYLIGASALDDECARLIAKISNAGAHDIIISVSALEQVNYPLIRDFVNIFPEKILAGTKNIRFVFPGFQNGGKAGEVIYQTPRSIYYVENGVKTGPLDESLTDYEN